MASNPRKVVGLTWFRRDDWLKVKLTFEDADQLHNTYDEWLASVERLERTMKIKGVAIEWVTIDPDTFPDWCRARNLRLNGEARSQFAGDVARQRHAGGDG